MNGLASRYRGILSRVEAAASACNRTGEVTLIAVSKNQPIEVIEELYRLGHRDFGENYVQELVSKAPALELRGCTGIRWHFIGHLQTNKVKILLPFVYSVHSVDSEKLGRELAKRAQSRLSIFLEVNLEEEPAKTGVAPEKVPALVKVLAEMPELNLHGLMCVPTPMAGANGTAFLTLRELESRCRPSTQGKLSMGMTSDFEVAIREGATHIRVGTAIFGPRPVAVQKPL